jgi:hypothetical protein
MMNIKQISIGLILVLTSGCAPSLASQCNKLGEVVFRDPEKGVADNELLSEEFKGIAANHEQNTADVTKLKLKEPTLKFIQAEYIEVQTKLVKANLAMSKQSSDMAVFSKAFDVSKSQANIDNLTKSVEEGKSLLEQVVNLNQQEAKLKAELKQACAKTP